MGNICIPFQHQLLQLFSAMIIWKLLQEPQIKEFQWEKPERNRFYPSESQNNNFRWPSSKFSDVESEYPESTHKNKNALRIIGPLV